MSALATLATWARMVKLSHSVFALPFAFAGAALAAVRHGITARQAVLVLVAMVAARNAALGFNRLADEGYDTLNPRTAGRELPRGILSRGAVWAFTLVLAALFVLAAFGLNPLCGILSPVALAVAFGYSYTKRFTWATHFVLGLALAMAPMGGWLAVAGRFAVEPWLLSAAVLLWVAGFDMVYACQDVEFDRRFGLHSIPARCGVRRALVLARFLHAGALGALASVGVVAGVHFAYWFGLVGIGALMAWGHGLVRPDDLSKAGFSFMNLNGAIGVAYLAVLLASLGLGGRVGAP